MKEKNHERYAAEALTEFAQNIFEACGLPASRAEAVAETLVEADLLGHTTHGLQLMAPYVQELESGGMTKEGEPEFLHDKGSAMMWDGKYLPGPWLIREAIDLALSRIGQHAIMTIVIRRCHHIGCLAVYPERVTRHSMMMLLSCSDPRNKTVAPFGGLQPVYSPNPIAAGIPTQAEPIIMDISTASTANGLVIRSRSEGKRLQHPWLMDSEGNPTDEPEAFFKDPPATILPLGGLDTGYKGFALGLLVEALTSCLGGYGRASEPSQWGSSVFMQIIDPVAFGGREAFKNETQFLAESCRASQPRQADQPVRLPGSRALELRAEQLRLGVSLYPTIVPALKKCADKYGVAFPQPIGA